ncbi:RNA polymerase sigma factor [Ferrovibrio sp.]|uniref:RNA polymerase sigma factor n=1 Tax=Ferrovibrio sp. TaxID=1917215 RepID=UPI0035158631
MKQDAARDLFVAQRAALIDYATPIVGDRGRAEDVVQEAFMRFAPALESQTAIEQPVAYLFRIVRNLAYDLRRRRSLERRQEAAEPEWWMIPAAPRTPEQQLLLTDSVARIQAALAGMPPQMRQAIELCRFQGCTVAEAGLRLGISGATVSRLVSRGMAQIVTRLNAEEDRTD